MASGPTTHRPGAVAALAWAWALSSTLAACHSTAVGVGGYERRGIGLPGERAEPYRPSDRILVGNLELVFDDELRVYRIAGHPHHYYIGIRYYRWADDLWEAAPSFGGPWKAIPRGEIPAGLRRITAPAGASSVTAPQP